MFNTSNDTGHVMAALVAISNGIGKLEPDAKNPHYGNDYISLDFLTTKVREAAKKHNCTVSHSASVLTHGSEQQPVVIMYVVTRLLHDTGEWMEVAVPVPLAKLDPQGAGGAMTYGRRYGLAAMFGIAADEDDDGNAGMAPSHTKARKTVFTLDEAKAFIMPFGVKSKGKKLDDCETKDIEGAVKWARENKKFDDLVAAGTVVMEDRMGAGA